MTEENQADDFKAALRDSSPPDDQQVPPNSATETPPGGTGGAQGGDPPAPPPPPPPPAAPPARTLEQAERELAEARDPKRLEEAQLNWARNWALQSPEHYRLMTGQEPPPGLQFANQQQPPAPKAGEGEKQDPNAALQQKVDALEKRDQAREAAVRSQALKDEVYDNFEKFEDVFDSTKNPLAGWAQQAVGDAVRREMLSGRKPDIGKVVADTAKAFRDHIQSVKDGYKQGKVDANRQVPPAPGRPGGPIPERAETNQANQSTRRQLSAALRDGGGLNL